MTSENFNVFAEAVRKRFADLASEQLFIVDTDRDAIWLSYLGAFPEGTNKLFRKRTEFDCSCCRAFIRAVGNMVGIQNEAMASIWDLNGLPQPYQTVADAMSAYVKSFPIKTVLVVKQAQQGTLSSHELVDGKTRTWHHFSIKTPSKFVAKEVATVQGDARTTQQVLLRGLTELKPEAVRDVMDLIHNNLLYRGAEHQRAITNFAQLQSRIMSASPSMRELLAWTMIDNPAARFRNTVIGTLVQDVSDGVDLETAVRSFETKVAPHSYKRPTALITKKMVADALETIEELGLEPALERRHARLSDVSVDSVLFVDNDVREKMKGGVARLLMEEVKPVPMDKRKATEIGVDEFMAKVLPKCTSIELYVDNGLAGNFVSMTAPIHESTGKLFRWDNDFAWSYEGNVADSIKERVKRAGGRVENVAMRVSLSWFNIDDLDLHVREPNGNHIFFGNKSDKLDVDMNVHTPVRDAVENVRWIKSVPDGDYRVSVHNFTKRESVDVGFEIEIEDSGGLRSLVFDKTLAARNEQPVAVITVQKGQITKVASSPGITVGAKSREIWGLKTLAMARVNSIVLSPNYWGKNAVGNKHWFFILDGCRNPLPTRGMYNEFLNGKLDKHRKVFEVLGDKTKCAPTQEQLSGLGFSSTRSDKVTVIAVGPNLNRPYTIVF